MLVITNQTKKPKNIIHFEMLTEKQQKQALEDFGQDAENGNYFIYQCQLLNLTGEFHSSHIKPEEWHWVLCNSAWTGIVIKEDDGEFTIANYHKYSIDFDDVCQKIIDILPHGSGIDTSWDYEQKQHYINFSCSYHMMNENGYYVGWQDFNVRIPLKSFVNFAYGHGKEVLQSFKLTIPNECYRSRMTDLRSYLEDTIMYSFMD